jgi:hypothetical protein
MVRRVQFASGLALLALAPMIAAAADPPKKKQNGPKTTVKPASTIAKTSTPTKATEQASAKPIATATPTPTPIAPVLDTAPDRDRDTLSTPTPPMRRFVITLNPLPIAAGRYGGNLEIVLAPHHVLTGGAYVQTFSGWMLRAIMPSGVEVGDRAVSRVGGEIGYRLYSGRDGATGIFVGPSFVAMPIVQPVVTSDLRTEVVSLIAYGGAVDVGVQAQMSSGFTIGGGLGVMALAYSRPASATPPPGVDAPAAPEPHVLPRVLFAAGWAF